MNRKEIKAKTIHQDNNTTGFNPRSNNQNGSAHTRRAKRLASKRLRLLNRKEIYNELEDLELDSWIQ